MTAQTSVAPKAKRTPTPLHGVDTPTLLATINAVGAQPSLGGFQFRATNRWISGTHSRSTMSGFFGAGGEHLHRVAYKADADHPAVLCGTDEAPAPVEWVLHALATCITGGIANIAAARGVRLRSVESTVVGDIDLRGILGLSKEVRNGYTAIKASFAIDGDATPEQLAAILEQAKARSAVFDIISNGTPVSIGVESKTKQ
ncbi:MAG TPA: OsmC family protein [Stellaceae bacterium]|nr:OsmC family protein [Stellaceae bacterium]